MLVRLAPQGLLLGILLVAVPVHAKSPSAFGEAFDKSTTAPPRQSDDDVLDGSSAERAPAKLKRVRPPNPNRRHKISLDGSQGTRDSDMEDDMP